MALPPTMTELSSADPVPLGHDSGQIDAPQLQLFVMGLFFIFGGITSLNDVLIPKLKELFTLSPAMRDYLHSAAFTQPLALPMSSWVPCRSLSRPMTFSMRAAS